MIPKVFVPDRNNHSNASSYLILAIVIILIIAACSTNNVSAATSAKDSPCSSGITLIPVKTEGYLDSGKYSAFIAQPNEGCDIPRQFCISMNNTWGGGGLSCTADVAQK